MSTDDLSPSATLDATASQPLAIRLTDRKGVELTIAAVAGQSLMQAIRAAGQDELLALCGGSCSCATCHVYIESHVGVALPPLSADEDDLLEGSIHRTPRSRLSCQVPITRELDGLSVVIAPEG